MSNFQIGDKVSVLDEAIDGVVVGVNLEQITIETADGFPMTYFVNEIVKNNISNELKGFISYAAISQVKIEKQEEKKRNFVKDKKSKKEIFTLEVDLHIEKLVPNKNGLSNYDILNIQMDTAKRQMDFAIRNRIPKLVLIHGVGEGVLKSELDFLLNRYENIRTIEGNYQKYGQGATEVYFLQKKEN
ncbi:Smr/MutS family protein [uncultured Flavobacterium sp.]|uniref:Smr/MutS family protein n=1 Tax=uncultured Flavobacterium sp. TaxID=165435 RepID=UPI0030CA579F